MFIKVALILLVATVALGDPTTRKPKGFPEHNGEKFFYFTYGDNMVGKRLKILTPSSVKIGYALLKDYSLDFNSFSSLWHGAAATILPNNGSMVYGVLWEMELVNLDILDRLERVPQGVYEPVGVSVTALGHLVVARSYKLVDQPKIPFNEMKNKPEERLPSRSYLRCLIKGASDIGIPKDYIDWLRTIKNNGKVSERMEEDLGLESIQLRY